MNSQEQIAEILLRTTSVNLRPNNPFTWASGWKSPIYCDNRRLLSAPYEREVIKSEMCRIIFEKFDNADAIAGVATAGIAWGAMASDQLKYPFMYVRPKPKEHGMGNQIEGDFSAGQKVLVVEDLISTGKSSIQVCDVLHAAGLHVIGMLAIFTYDFPIAQKAFDDAGISVTTLTSYTALISLAQQKNMFSKEQLNSLIEWRKDPAEWGIR